MKQSDLNRAVARATGESVSLVRRRGFSVFVPTLAVRPPEPDSEHDARPCGIGAAPAAPCDNSQGSTE